MPRTPDEQRTFSDTLRQLVAQRQGVTPGEVDYMDIVEALAKEVRDLRQRVAALEAQVQ